MYTKRTIIVCHYGESVYPFCTKIMLARKVSVQGKNKVDVEVVSLSLFPLMFRAHVSVPYTAYPSSPAIWVSTQITKLKLLESNYIALRRRIWYEKTPIKVFRLHNGYPCPCCLHGIHSFSVCIATLFKMIREELHTVVKSLNNLAQY